MKPKKRKRKAQNKSRPTSSYLILITKELKGVEPVQKFKIHVDPSIYVDNELKT